MKLGEYKKSFGVPTKQVTLGLAVKNGRVLLAMKKRGFGQGKWNGVGGKVEPGESIEEAAKREAGEEIGIVPEKMRQVATIHFYFKNKPEWNQTGTGFIFDSWSGEPKESEEMAPQWFAIEDVPYDSMWSDDKYWMPLVLKGKKVVAEFLFGDNDLTEDMKVTEIKTVNQK